MDEEEALINLVYSMFYESCWDRALQKFCHQYVPAYQDAQEFLIQRNRIKEEDCYY